MQAVRLLSDMGYSNVGHYAGGMEEWLAHGEPVESGPVTPPRRTTAPSAGSKPAAARRAAAFRAAALRPVTLRPVAWIERLASLPYATLLGLWLAMVVGMGLLYWVGALAGFGQLLESGDPVRGDGQGLATAIYFSVVTATSVGFGDVVPRGFLRLLATVEAAGGLLIFGCIVSKLVSRHQEELAEETHRIAFEDRLDRLRTNLHLVLSELQSLAAELRQAGLAAERLRLLARLESTAMVLSGELRAIHDLLYRPQQQPEEMVVEGLLANLSVSMDELRMLIVQMPEGRRQSALLDSTLRAISMAAQEICGHCVPREYAGPLTVWMDRIQSLARELDRA